jgi:peptidoglycan/xylan/chitin deacetylase (PgdA/CDA1 family)
MEATGINSNTFDSLPDPHMKKIAVLAFICLLAQLTAVFAESVLENRFMRVSIDPQTGGIAQIIYLRDSQTALVFGAGDRVLETAAGAFHPTAFAVTQNDSTSVTLASSAFRGPDADLPLRTTIQYRLAGYRLSVDYCFEAADRVEMNDGLDIRMVSSSWDRLDIRNHFSGEDAVQFGQSGQPRYFALNQVYELRNAVSKLSLVFPNPYQSLVTITPKGSQSFEFSWHVLAASPPIKAAPPAGPPLASVLTSGVQLRRQVDVIITHVDENMADLAGPVAYFSPFPAGYDQVIAMTFDDIPFQRWVYPTSGHDQKAGAQQYLIRLLEDHPRMKMGWVVLPDGIFYPTDLQNPDYTPGRWWTAHSVHRMLAAAPAGYLNWLRAIERDSLVYGYEDRVRLGNHGYHHTPEMQFGQNWEFQSYDPVMNDSTFSAIVREYDLLGLGAISRRWIRFPGFWFTRATVDALIKYGFALFDYTGIYDKLPWMLFYSDNGHIWGIGSGWEGDTPRSYEDMEKILRAGKLCDTAGHPQFWFDGDPEAAYLQIHGMFQRAEDDFPNLGYLFPDEVADVADETYGIHGIESTVNGNEYDVAFIGAATRGETIDVEWPDATTTPDIVTVDDRDVRLMELRNGRLVVVLPELSNGVHTLRITSRLPSRFSRPIVPALDLVLNQNYPNPFGSETIITFQLPAASHMTLAVFDPQGKRVAVLEDGQLSQGPHAVRWTGRDESGRLVASGVYFCRLSVGNATHVRKMILIR